MDAVEAHVAVRAGITLPDDYLRVGVDTLIEWDGTRWLVGRQVERVENANGVGFLYEDGTAVVSGEIVMTTPCSIAEGSQFISNGVTATFPISFDKNARAVVEMGDSIVHRDIRQTNLSTFVVESWCNTSNASTTDVVPYSASGEWF